ncbi:hypothetical protein [Cellvibrio sp. UBA7671]|uniref:hypothetical protein n=1 Tax=Cellvibrio sp. UBA7671 TaxID=1946312 RepID=UPI002F354FA5
MNINYLEICTQRHHKATLALVEKLVGVPSELVETCPVIAKKGTELHMVMPGITGLTIDYDFVNPYIMNGAFSLELKMKFLNLIETGNKIEAGHRLLGIFSELSNDTKEFLRENLKIIVKNSSTCKEVTKILNQESKIQFNWDLHKLLSNSDMAFERWRYIYESSDDSTWFAGYSEIQKALDLRIADLKSR